MKSNVLALILPSIVLLGCSPKAPSSTDELIGWANDDDRRQYSNVILDHDANGQLVFYGNYDNPPSDLGNLQAIRAGIRENCYFADLTYDDGTNHWSYSRHVDGTFKFEGDVVFNDFSGGMLALDQFEDGAVFLGKRSSDLTYIAPLSLTFSELYYIGQVAPLDF